MENQMKQLISKELERFYCSILLDEVKEKVRKLKAYGVDETEIMAAMNEEELFPKLIITEDYKIVLHGEQPVEVEMEPPKYSEILCNIGQARRGQEGRADSWQRDLEMQTAIFARLVKEL